MTHFDLDFARGLTRSKRAPIERSDAIILTVIALVHAVIVGLLVRAVYNSGVFERSPPPTSMELYSFADAPKAPAPKVNFVHEPQIAVDVQPPDVEIEDVASKGDPFGGAALRPNSAPAADGDRIAESPEFDSLAQSFRERIRGRVAGGAIALTPAIVEVLAKPGGGFVDVRIKQSSGTGAIDQELLAAIMLRQTLVPAGSVSEKRWLLLPEITFGV